MDIAKSGKTSLMVLAMMLIGVGGQKLLAGISTTPVDLNGVLAGAVVVLVGVLLAWTREHLKTTNWSGQIPVSEEVVRATVEKVLRDGIVLPRAPGVAETGTPKPEDLAPKP